MTVDVSISYLKELKSGDGFEFGRSNKLGNFWAIEHSAQTGTSFRCVCNLVQHSVWSERPGCRHIADFPRNNKSLLANAMAISVLSVHIRHNASSLGY